MERWPGGFGRRAVRAVFPICCYIEHLTCEYTFHPVYIFIYKLFINKLPELPDKQRKPAPGLALREIQIRPKPARYQPDFGQKCQAVKLLVVSVKLLVVSVKLLVIMSGSYVGHKKPRTMAGSINKHGRSVIRERQHIYALGA